MSKINTLLKYRFSKKTSDKIQHDVCESNSSQSSDSVDGRLTPEVNSEPSVIKETPTSQQPSPPSPVIQKKKKSNMSDEIYGPLDSDSDDDSSTGKSKRKSNGKRKSDSGDDNKESSGAWLSKKSGSLLNGFNDALLQKKQVSRLSYGRRRLKSDSEDDCSEDESEAEESSEEYSGSTIPTHSQSQESSKSKRVREESFESQGSDVVKPKKRARVRMMSDSSDDTPHSSVKPAGSMSNQHEDSAQNKATKPSKPVILKTEEKIARMVKLKAKCPTGTAIEKMREALEKHNWELEDAANEVLSDNADSDSKKGGASVEKSVLNTEGKVKRMSVIQNSLPGVKLDKIRTALEENEWNIQKATQFLEKELNMKAVPVENKESETTDKGKCTASKVSDIKVVEKEDNEGSDGSKAVEESADAMEDGQNDEDEDDEEMANAESDEEEEESERGPVLSFFDSATMDELINMPGCSKKKAEVILGLRPFEDWEDLVKKFSSTKPLSYSLVSRCWEVIQIREVVIRLMQRCEKISEKLEKMVSTLAGKVTLVDYEDQITTQPRIMNSKMQMKPYQIVGLNWLRLMHTQELNGILADEMGLGKTVQAISFLAHLLEEGDDGPHVIIVPSSTIENWLNELQMWCPDLQVVVYYGSQEERRRLRKEILYDTTGNSLFNVLLTTYNMTSGSLEDRSVFKQVEFHYAIFDEGHMLKNMSSQRYQHLQKIRAYRRLLLTGTPLQNNLLELMSLLCFVMPDMFVGKTEHLKRMFTMITTKGDESQGEYEKERITHAKNIMKPFVLRRLKADVLKQLPKKHEKVEHCPMIPEQQTLYDNMVDQFSKNYIELGDGVLVTREASSGGAAMLMQLRKCANHPLLHRNYYTDEKIKSMSKKISKEPSHQARGALPHIIQEDMAVMSDFELHKLCQLYKKYLADFQLETYFIEDSGKFRFLDNFLEDKLEKGDRVLLFSQFTMMLDIIEEYVKLKHYKYCRLDGQTPVVERQEMINEYNSNADIFLFLLSTRAGGLGINLTSANVVVIHDIDFNPYNDKQAEDRCHRVGQTRTVEVVKLISQDTVEEGMLRCAKHKLKLEKDVTTTGTDEDDNPSDVLSLLKDILGRHMKEEQKSRAIEDGPV